MDEGFGEEVRPEVRSFAREMERKLRLNDHKGGWSDCNPFWLLYRAREELAELEAEVIRRSAWGRGVSPKVRKDLDPARVLEEAADVANFVMMLADVVGR